MRKQPFRHSIVPDDKPRTCDLAPPPCPVVRFSKRYLVRQPGADMTTAELWKGGDYVAKNYRDRDVAHPEDVWIVDQQLFNATYQAVER